MALAVVPRRGRDDLPPDGGEPETPPPSLADRLAAAQRAEVQPRSRVAELSAALDAAKREERFDDAARLKDELSAARVALGHAEIETRNLRDVQAEVERQRAADAKALDDARREAEARRVINDATGSEKRALDGIDQALAEMRAALDAARAAFLRAQAWEDKAGQERRRVLDARVVLGEAQPFGRPPAKPNRASVLTESAPLVRELLRWDGRQW